MLEVGRRLQGDLVHLEDHWAVHVAVYIKSIYLMIIQLTQTAYAVLHSPRQITPRLLMTGSVPRTKC